MDEALLKPMPSPHGLSDGQLLAVVCLRLMAAEQMASGFRERATYATEVAPGLLQVLVADFPEVVVPLEDEDLAEVLERLVAGR